MRLLRPVLLLWLALELLSGAPRPGWKELREQIKAALHIPDPLPETDPKPFLKFTPANGVTAERVSYKTDYGLRVPAIVYHATGVTIVKHPALVIVNGHGGDKSSWYAYWAGILYARAGAVVLTYDPIGEFERNQELHSNTSQHDTLIPPDDMGRRMGGLMVTDVMQAVHYLSERPDVDPKRIAVLGFSMGSFISSLACAVDTAINACVLAGGGDLDGPGGYWDSSGKKMCQAIPYQSLAFLGDRGPMLYALNAKRGPTLVLNGTADTVVDIPHHGEDFFENLRKETIAAGGSSKNVFDFEFTSGGGHRPYFLTKAAALWLQEKLIFPNWTKKQIQAMPETHISEWSIQNHLQPTTTPANEVGAGGTMALGNDVPAVPKDSLRAIPPALWQVDQSQYIYETWRAGALAAQAPAQPKP